MDGQTLARIGALVFVAIALTAALVEARRAAPEPAPVERRVPRVRETETDPLQAALRRCQHLGEAATRDPACLAAWAENRRRFLGGDPEAH